MGTPARMTITGHAPTVTSGPSPLAAKIARWQQALDRATTPERRAAVQAELDKLTGTAGMTRDEQITHLRAELAKLEG
jgi:hypothetical protein